MKKVRQAYRFTDISEAIDFIKVNKLPYDEVIVLFDLIVEEQQAQEVEESIKEQPINKDELIEKLIRENEQYRNKKEATKEMPSPPLPTKKDNMRIIAI